MDINFVFDVEGTAFFRLLFLWFISFLQLMLAMVVGENVNAYQPYAFQSNQRHFQKV